MRSAARIHGCAAAKFICFVLLLLAQAFAFAEEEEMRVALAQPHTPPENRNERFPEWNRQKDGLSQTAQHDPPTRRLSQRRSSSPDTEDVACQLTRQEIAELLDEETRTWLVDSAALESVSGDLGAVINCTRENDVVLLDVEDDIRVPARVTVPWNLTLSSYVTSTELADGTFPEAERKVRLRCPPKDGIFHIRSQSVLLANLVFRGCSLDGDDASIVEVGDCLPDSSPGLIRLHHVAFRRNSLDGASGLSFSSSSCSSLEMIDVAFSGNTCGDRCFARLSPENDLRGLTLRRNRRVSGGRLSSSLMSSSSGSSSTINRLRASSNELSVIRVVEGSLEMRDAEIRTSNQSSLLLDRAQAVTVIDSAFHENFAHLFGAAIFSNATNSIAVSNCNFTSNSAENGAAVASFDGNLTIYRCYFQDNFALVNAGSLLVSNGTLELLSSVFYNNTASGKGGAIFITASNSTKLSVVQCHNNTAGDGGCLHAFASRDLIVRKSILSKNSAENGGALYCDGVLDSKIVDTTFAENSVLDKGGGIFLSSSLQMELHNCKMNNNSAKTGGGLDCRFSEHLEISQCVFLANNVSLDGAGAHILDESSARLEDIIWLENTARGEGGGIMVENSTIKSHRCNYLRNEAGSGAGLNLVDGKANMTEDRFLGNTAQFAGGGMAFDRSTVYLKNCSAMQNDASHGGGMIVAEAVVVIHNMTFIKNRAQVSRGAGIACLRGETTILDSSFLSNNATVSGGSMDFLTCNVTASNLTIRSNRADTFGGGISCSRRTLFNLSDSVLQFNSALDSGGLVIQDNTVMDITTSVFDSNKATSGGGIGVYRNSRIVLKNSTISSNRAERLGGAFRLHEGNMIILGGLIINNEAILKGGCLTGGVSSTFNATNCSFRDNRADIGGCLYSDRKTRVHFHNCVVENNTATEDGGAVFLEDSEASANKNTFRRNKARVGGSITMKNSSVQLTKSLFAEDKATLIGGSIAANQNNSLIILETTILKTKTENGGSIWLSGSNLSANALKVSNCVAKKTGGAIMANASSILLCAGCTFDKNKAGKQGGAIAFDSSEPRSPALQLNNCTFNDNNASIGGVVIIGKQTIPNNHHVVGAVHVATYRRRKGCMNSDDPCTFVAVTGSRFSRNKAKISGGAIFLTDPTVLRYSCSPKDTEVPPAIDATNVLEELDVLESAEDICPEWSTNEAGLYGPNIASSARSARGFTVGHDTWKNEKPVKNNELVSKNHRSGDSLPKLLVEVMDGYGQSPALGEGDAFVQATVRSPNDLFSGEINMPVNEKRKGFPSITGFQHPGRYEIQIDFSESGLESLIFEVQVRGCQLGEFSQENGTLCVLCSGSQYNFDPDATTCQPCPENGNCTTDVIHPNSGYWHRTPCSRHVQQCVSREACDFNGREGDLDDVTSEMEICELDESLDRDYSQAQCKEGYTGLLCGSCDAGYGRSWSFDCGKCLHDSGTVLLLVASLFVLLILSSFAIRSNLNTQPVENQNSRIRISRRNRRLVPPKKRPSNDTPGNFEMMETVNTTEVQPEDVRPEPLATATTKSASTTDPTIAKIDPPADIAKRTVVEIFKISINFLQVIAAAAIINVNWTSWMRSLLFGADFVSGAATAGVALSVDCLFDQHNDPPRSVLRSVVHLLIPAGILIFYLIFWILMTRKYKENTWYFAKRALLSFLAVSFITYVSITKTAVNTLHCIKVHDSTGFNDDHTDEYWALDTSLKCYEGSHAILASTAGWPVLAIFSFGLPALLAYVLIRQRSHEPGQNPWLADATGFLYRAYKERFVFWESIVMLRKAVLTVVVTFSYPLGTNIQGILAVCILTFANYIHGTCQPFDEPYGCLNAFETASLVVSQLTFASGLFFNDDRTSGVVKIFLTVLLSMAICGYLLVLSYTFVKSAKIYLKAVLEDQGMTDIQDWGILRVLKAYVSMRFSGSFGHLFRNRKNKPSNKPNNPAPPSNV